MLWFRLRQPNNMKHYLTNNRSLEITLLLSFRSTGHTSWHVMASPMRARIKHYTGSIIMSLQSCQLSVIASQVTDNSIVYSTACSDNTQNIKAPHYWPIVISNPLKTDGFLTKISKAEIVLMSCIQSIMFRYCYSVIYSTHGSMAKGPMVFFQ